MKTKIIASGFGILALYLFLSWLNGWWPFIKTEEKQAQADIAGLPNAPAFTANDVVLLFAPHPDDESLSNGGTVSMALAAGAKVYICWMCAGDGFELDAAYLVAHGTLTNADTLLFHNAEAMMDLGRTRIGEARNAATTLNVPAANQIFLGYGDGTIIPMFTYPDSVVTSTYSKVSKGPYTGTLAYGEDYCGRHAERHIQKLIDSLNPTIVYAPAPIDNQPDHMGTSFFVVKAMESLKKTNIMRNYIVHGGDYIIKDMVMNLTEYPIPHGLHPEMALNQPIIGNSYKWTRTAIDTAAENRKLAAVKCHVSQMDVMSGMMLGFIRTNELYATLDSAERAVHPQQLYFRR